MKLTEMERKFVPNGQVVEVEFRNREGSDELRKIGKWQNEDGNSTKNEPRGKQGLMISMFARH